MKDTFNIFLSYSQPLITSTTGSKETQVIKLCMGKNA